MSKDFYVGVDGGGTKTKVLITDSDFVPIGEGVGGSSNIRLSVENSWDSINKAINSALDGTGLSINDSSCNFHAGMGLAGVSIKQAEYDFLNTKHPFKTLLLETDAHVACLGAHDGQDGSIISIGTGVIGYSIKGDTNFRLGGWGFPHADTAGGAWLGMEIVRLALSWNDGCIPGSQLLKNIYNHFDNNQTEFITWANNSKSTDFATLAPIVIQGLKTNDKYALLLMNQAAEEIQLMANTLRKNADNKESKCLLLGGISPFLFPYMKDKSFLALGDKTKTADKGAIYMLKRYFNK
ncbi:MAG TPA: BadF/BadG/BcrA/BcrD ATPase family protein [Victivallales bacterium]|nr:BadF/BadG/BcrA/BcrD ATPase family protein [Victivallales bacterium]